MARLTAVDVPVGTSIVVRRCAPKRACASRRLTVRTAETNLIAAAGSHAIGRGGSLEIRLTHAERIGRVITYAMRGKAMPLRRQRDIR